MGGVGDAVRRVFDRALHRRAPVYGYRFSGDWLDIGDHGQLLEADNRVEEVIGTGQFVANDCRLDASDGSPRLAYATDFVEKSWPLNYRGGLGKLTYPSEGSLPIAASSARAAGARRAR